jgi:hypothetical protein
MRKSPLAFGTSVPSSHFCCSSTALRRPATAASKRVRSAPVSSPACDIIMSSTMPITPAFCLATVCAWMSGTRAGSRFSRDWANSAGIFSMRSVAFFRRSGHGAKSRATRV